MITTTNSIPRVVGSPGFIDKVNRFEAEQAACLINYYDIYNWLNQILRHNRYHAGGRAFPGLYELTAAIEAGALNRANDAAKAAL